jgi:hypothetical protein
MKQETKVELVTQDYKGIISNIAACSSQLGKLAPEAMQGWHAMACSASAALRARDSFASAAASAA